MNGNLEGQGIDSQPFQIFFDQQIIDYDTGIVIEEELIPDPEEESAQIEVEGDNSSSTTAKGVDELSFTRKSG